MELYVKEDEKCVFQKMMKIEHGKEAVRMDWKGQSEGGKIRMNDEIGWEEKLEMYNK